MTRSRFRGDPLACFDRLPQAVRRALHESHVDWYPLWVRWEINRRVKVGASLQDAIDQTMAQIAADNRAEAYRFAHRWPSRFGRYPAIAARSSCVRYERQDSRSGNYPLVEKAR